MIDAIVLWSYAAAIWLPVFLDRNSKSKGRLMFLVRYHIAMAILAPFVEQFTEGAWTYVYYGVGALSLLNGWMVYKRMKMIEEYEESVLRLRKFLEGENENSTNRS